MYQEDDDDYGQDKLQMQRMERARQEFIKGCYEAYQLLVDEGPRTLQGAEITSIQRAINRMTSFFIMREEYEKCQFLKSFVTKYMPDFEIQPDESIQRDLNP